MGAFDTEGKSTEEMLAQLLQNQQEHRAEVASLREEVNARRASAPTGAPATAASPEELAQARAEEISSHSHYCPGCGRLYDYQQRCTGSPEAPHAPLEVVETSELHPDADPADHTAAPNTGT